MNSLTKAYIQVLNEGTFLMGQDTTLADILKETKFEDFSESDFDAFAGVETDNPIIGTYKDYQIIIDGNDIILLSDNEESAGFSQKTFSLKLQSTI